jgi:hypothetical protein
MASSVKGPDNTALHRPLIYDMDGAGGAKRGVPAAEADTPSPSVCMRANLVRVRQEAPAVP